MEEKATLVPAARQVLLAVGCGGALLALCRDAARHVGVDLEAVELTSFAASAASLRPLVVMIAADLYSFDPEEFDALARAVGATRLLVEVGEPRVRLFVRLADALRTVIQSRTQKREPEDPVPRRRRPSSGIRWRAVDDGTGAGDKPAEPA